MFLQSNDDHEVVPGSEFIISRTAFKDNSSYYEYNSKKVQFKEIAKVLRSEGVDLDHNRFLILQVKFDDNDRNDHIFNTLLNVVGGS